MKLPQRFVQCPDQDSMPLNTPIMPMFLYLPQITTEMFQVMLGMPQVTLALTGAMLPLALLESFLQEACLTSCGMSQALPDAAILVHDRMQGSLEVNDLTRQCAMVPAVSMTPAVVPAVPVRHAVTVFVTPAVVPAVPARHAVTVFVTPAALVPAVTATTRHAVTVSMTPAVYGHAATRRFPMAQ